MATIVTDFYMYKGQAVTWDDVHGAEMARRAVDDYFCALQHPSAWRGAAKPRNRLLLTGQPGTGKTRVVRAIAHQATMLSLPESSRTSGQQLTVFAPTGTDFMSAGKARALVQLAAEKAPSIIFVDECDSTFSSGGQRVSQRVQELKILLGDLPMDVLFICATNHLSNIDLAIKSRLGDPIELPLPDTDTRRRIMQTALNGNEFEMGEGDWAAIAQATEGRDGRWLAETLCCEVACAVAREAGVSMEPRAIKLADFEFVLAAKGGGSTSAAASQQAPPATGALVVASAAAPPPAAPSASAGASQLAPPPAGGALALVEGGSDHTKRVVACHRLFKRVPGSPRRFRHEVYAYIAQHERDAWETVSTGRRRENALKQQQGSYPTKQIVEAWGAAMAEALDGFTFGDRVQGDTGEPRGYWTTELAFNAV